RVVGCARTGERAHPDQVGRFGRDLLTRFRPLCRSNKKRRREAPFSWDAMCAYEQWIVPVLTDEPSVTFTMKSPWPVTENETFTFPPVTGATLAVPVAPAAGATLAKYLPLPPLARNWNV